MQARDVLADDVQLRRPTGLEAVVGETGRGEIVGQRVEPDPRALRLAGREREREGNGPRQTRTRDRDVLEPLVEQREDLVAPRSPARGSPDARRTAGEGILRTTTAGRTSCAPSSTRSVARRMQHALPVDDLVVALEQLAADAVPAFVALLVEVVRRCVRGCARSARARRACGSRPSCA